MDLCEPLNRAHSNQRRAELALRSGNLDEAIKKFSAAAENFIDAESQLIVGQRQPLTIASDIYTLETLIAQRRFCLRQVELLKSKLEQLRRQFLALMEEKKKGASSLSNLDYDRALSDAAALGLSSGDRRFDASELKQRLWEKINQQDSLLGQLENDGQIEAGDPDQETTTPIRKGSQTGAKVPSDKTVIEELRQCNEALRHFIVILLNELETKTDEIERLKNELQQNSNTRPSSPRQRSSTTPSKNQNKKRTESESGKLPELPPLELPPLKSLADRKPL